MKAGPFGPSNDSFVLPGVSDIELSDTFDATGPKFECSPNGSDSSSCANGKNKLPKIAESHHRPGLRQRIQQPPPCPQCGYTYSTVPSSSDDENDEMIVLLLWQQLVQVDCYHPKWTMSCPHLKKRKVVVSFLLQIVLLIVIIDHHNNTTTTTHAIIEE